MIRHLGALLMLLAVAVLTGVVIWQVDVHGAAGEGQRPERGGPVAVEVAPVTTGAILDRRILSGTLEASTRFEVAAKVGGLIEQVMVDIGDPIERNQIVAEVEDSEFVQAVAQADAELAVRRAAQAQAASAADLAEREYQRALEFMERAMASDAELDEKRTARESTRAALNLAEAQVAQAQATLELARIRQNYTHVRAEWSGGPDSAIVGERYQDAGNSITANTPILSVVTLDPLTAVVAITERDYARITIGLPAKLTADGAPGHVFDATVARIAPVFRETSRQARIELRVDNADGLLKPGMFVRVAIILDQRESETIVPLAALTRRSGQDAVFVLDENGAAVKLVPITIGIMEGERVSVAEPLTGNVVVLGQQLLENGSPVRVANDSRPTSSPATAPSLRRAP